MKIKEIAYYGPMLALVSALALVSPKNAMVVQAEEELFVNTEGGEFQEDIDGSTAENVETSIEPEVTIPPIEDATEDNNQNQLINGDSDYYFDNSNYYSATDDSENPGTTVPEGTEDEVARKGLEPGTPTPTPTPDKEPPQDIPKMGSTDRDYAKEIGVGTLGLLVVYGLKEIAIRIHLAANRAELEEDGVIPVKSARRKFRRKNKKGKKLVQ